MDPKSVAAKNARNLNFIKSDATKVKKTSLALLMVHGKKGRLSIGWKVTAWRLVVLNYPFFFLASTSHKLYLSAYWQWNSQWARENFCSHYKINIRSWLKRVGLRLEKQQKSRETKLTIKLSAYCILQRHSHCHELPSLSRTTCCPLVS